MRVNAVAAHVPFGELHGVVRSLEAAGCQGLFFAEIAHDPFLPVAAAATASPEMVLGTEIALAFPRGPVPLAYAAHDLDAATAGRFVLGLGPQVRPHIERRFGMTWTDPVARMRELVAAMRAVWDCWRTGGPLRFDGDHYRLSLMPPAFRPEPTEHPPPPVYLAAVGPRMARLAGEIADGLFLHAFSTPEYVRQVLLPAVEDGLRASGRTRDDIQLCYPPFLAAGSTGEDVAEARAAVRSTVAFYASTPDYRRVLAVHGAEALQPELQRLTREGSWDEMGALVGDEVLDLFCISGGPDDVAGQLQERWGGLVDQVSLPYEFWSAHASDPAWRAATARLSEQR